MRKISVLFIISVLTATIFSGCSCRSQVGDASGEPLTLPVPPETSGEAFAQPTDTAPAPAESQAVQPETLPSENVPAETLPPESAVSETVPAGTVAPAAASGPMGSRYALWSDPNNGILTDLGRFPDYQTYPNASIPYGNDWEDKDAVGLPNGVHYYESLYGKYHPVYYINTAEKVLYLTMDEGYEAGYTPRILDTLKEKGVHAVFFVTKEFLDSDPELVQRMIDEGHVLGNHTCLHPSGGYPNYVASNGVQTFIDDVSNLHKLIYDRFGYSMQLFRFPEGEASEMLMAELDNLGYVSVFWSYAHRDYVLDDQPDPAVTLDRCLSHMAPGAVYLLHAVSSSNTEALAAFIDQARAAGYSFGDFPVSQVTAY